MCETPLFKDASKRVLFCSNILGARSGDALDLMSVNLRPSMVTLCHPRHLLLEMTLRVSRRRLGGLQCCHVLVY